MEHFYFVADYTSRYYLDVENILISAGTGWNNGKWFNWGLKGIERLFVDSGGFSFFKKWGEYPFDVQAYIDFIHSVSEGNNLEICATRDYPCEIEVNRTKFKSNQERINATVEGAVECMDADASLPWIPVLQGYRLEEYLNCLDLYNERGIQSDYYAIGSVCARKGNPLVIRNLITKLQEKTNARLHSFGLSLVYLSDPNIFQSLYSSDSAAWARGVNRHEDKPRAVKSYLSKIERIQSGLENQLTIEEAA